MSAWPRLLGRDRECELLSRLLTDVRAGRSRALVIRGETGIGKTALLEFLIGRASGCRVRQAAGVESEAGLPFAALHQVCAPLLNRLGDLPAPQRDGLATTFGLQSGQPPSPLLVGLAVLNLLTVAAEEQSLLCVVDDAQWLDESSAQILEFVARRLGVGRVGVLLATREPEQIPTWVGLPELLVQGLSTGDAAALLQAAVPGRLDAAVRDRILAEAHGSPLALLELPRELSAAELNFGFTSGPSTPSTLLSRLERGFLPQLSALPDQARQLLVLAAAEPIGDVPLLWRAAQRLAIGRDAFMAVEASGLLELRQTVQFQHPLVRSVVYRAASPPERRLAHRALADVSDPDEDPDRLAWHRARAAVDPDEAVAADLQRCADRAFGRGGLGAAAACLEAAAGLTPDPGRRAQRSLAAAQAKVAAGAFDDATALLAMARVGPLDAGDHALLALLHARIAHHSPHGRHGPAMLLSAAQRLEAFDPGLARATCLEAVVAAVFAGRLAPASAPGIKQAAEAVRHLDVVPGPGRLDLLLRAVTGVLTEGDAAAAPALHRAVGAFVAESPTVDEASPFVWLAGCAASDLWDDFSWEVLTRRHLDAARQVGALGVLPLALDSRAIFALVSGDLPEAESLVAEAAWVADVTGGRNVVLPYAAMCVSAMRGDVSGAVPRIRQLRDDIEARGEGYGLNLVSWFEALMYNARGRFSEALRAARSRAAAPLELGPPKWALGELVEAAVGSGEFHEAAAALEQLSGFAQASGTDCALGFTAARRALLTRGNAAEECYHEAIERLTLTCSRVELARAQLLYGEWLRREGRRAEARGPLRKAYDKFASMGVEGFAERARVELGATGEKVRTSSAGASAALTTQEARIARLAASGITNAEIGAQLYLSTKTVEWHLRKVFAKVGVSSRRELTPSLPGPAAPPQRQTWLETRADASLAPIGT